MIGPTVVAALAPWIPAGPAGPAAGSVAVLAGLPGPVTVLAGVDVTGGSAPVVAAVFVLLAVTTALSLLVSYRFARGYLRARTRPLLLLAVGLFMLTAVPTLVRLAFTNVVEAPAAYRTLLASLSELVGLLAILYTIYR